MRSPTKRKLVRKVKRPSGTIRISPPSKEQSKKDYLENTRIYDPNFETTITPSIEGCIDILVDQSLRSSSELTKSLNNARNKWRRKSGFGHKSLDKATNVALDLANDFSKTLDDMVYSYNNPPKNLKKMQRSCFKDILEAYVRFHYGKEFQAFALLSTPCFFEPSDLDVGLSWFLNHKSYRSDEQYGGTKSRNIRLREVNPNSDEKQKVDVGLSITPEESIGLKYVVYTHQDKLDVVVDVEEDKIVLSHYDIARYTPRGENQASNAKFQIIKSAKTGNFIVRRESRNDSGLFHRNKDEMEAERFFKLISSNPIFLGGNAFLHVVDYIRKNRNEILEAAQYYKQ